MQTDEKWVEVNINLKNGSHTNDVLLGFVKDYVSEAKKKSHLISWHYLLEPSIRLRFCGSAETAIQIRDELDSRLTSLESSSRGIYISHLFGGHGDPSKEYTGEVENFGQRGWPIFKRYLQNCSEVSLEFLENEPTDGAEKPREYYIERFAHLFLNQIGVQTYLAERDQLGDIPQLYPQFSKWLMIPLI